MKINKVRQKLIDQIVLDVQEPDRRFCWNMSHVSVAERLDCSPRLLKKVMRELVSSGLLTTNGGRCDKIAYFATKLLFESCSQEAVLSVKLFRQGKVDLPLESRCFFALLCRSVWGTSGAHHGSSRAHSDDDLEYSKSRMCPRDHHDSRGLSFAMDHIKEDIGELPQKNVCLSVEPAARKVVAEATPDRQTSSTESLGDAVVVHDKLVELTFGLVRYDETFRQAHLELIRETGLLSEELEGLVEHFFRTRVTTDRLTRPTFKNVVDPVVVAEYRQTVALTEKRLRKLAQQEYREHRKVDREALAEKVLTDLVLRGATEELREESAELLDNKKEHSAAVFVEKVEELVARHERFCRENRTRSTPEERL